MVNRSRTKIKEYYMYLWWWTALGPRLLHVENANAKAGSELDATANPIHSIISPKKLAPEIYSNMPPENLKIWLTKLSSDYICLQILFKISCFMTLFKLFIQQVKVIHRICVVQSIWLYSKPVKNRKYFFFIF